MLLIIVIVVVLELLVAAEAAIDARISVHMTLFICLHCECGFTV
jgi:hypothetical protein